MEVQQDAVKYTCETLGVPYSRPKELDAIRITRIDAISQTMYGKQDRVSKSSFIRRFDMSQGSFTLLTVFSDRREYVRRQVYMGKLMSVQRTFVMEKLQCVVDKLRRDEMAHRKKRALYVSIPLIRYYKARAS
jgi:hypothetical protein